MSKIPLFFNDDLPHNQHRTSPSKTKHVQQFGDQPPSTIASRSYPEILITGHAGKDKIRRCVREELELNLVSRTRNLIHSAASSSVPEFNNVFASQTAQRSSFGSSSRPTVKRQNILGPLHVVLLRTETQRRIQKDCRGCSQVLSWNKNKTRARIVFSKLVVKRKDVLGVWKSLIYPASTSIDFTTPGQRRRYQCFRCLRSDFLHPAVKSRVLLKL